MAEVIGVLVSGADKVGVLYYGENQTFRESAQHGVIDGYGLGPAGRFESLEFDSRQVIEGMDSLA